MVQIKKVTGLMLIVILTAGCLEVTGQQVKEVPRKEDPDGDLAALFSVPEPGHAPHSGHLTGATGDFNILASTGFLIYKTFVSSQDKPSCIFTPSCSEYAMLCIEKKGLILGWLGAFDRLSRCHGLVNHEHYPFDPEKQRFYDPVD
jgi:putative component of membrane protein insertase Oxa1/YidC/SpoIIIJ protein YidD